MNHLSVRRRTITLAALSAASLLVACEDKRVKQLDTGITKDSAMSVIAKDLPPGSGPDAYPNVYTRGQFLINGKTIEVLYFTPDNKKEPDKNYQRGSKDTIPLRELTPIVFVENRMVGKGWDFWDSVATANKIQVPPKK